MMNEKSYGDELHRLHRVLLRRDLKILKLVTQIEAAIEFLDMIPYHTKDDHDGNHVIHYTNRAIAALTDIDIKEDDDDRSA